MESFGNEEIVQQGEDWNLDKLLSASSREYIPFIVSNRLRNPYFVVTVASTKYEKNLRYVKSWWNSLEETYTEDHSRDMYLPTFYDTNPVEYGEVNLGEDGKPILPTEPNTTDVNDPTYGETYATRRLYHYTIKGETRPLQYTYETYHCFYFEYNSSGTLLGRVDDYQPIIKFNFRSTDTAEWNGQNYMYQITLVGGILMKTKLLQIYEDKGSPKDWPDFNDPDYVAKAYAYVKVTWPNELQPDIDADSPLGKIETPIPILRPTKLEVRNNLRTLI